MASNGGISEFLGLSKGRWGGQDLRGVSAVWRWEWPQCHLDGLSGSSVPVGEASRDTRSACRFVSDSCQILTDCDSVEAISIADGVAISLPCRSRPGVPGRYRDRTTRLRSITNARQPQRDPGRRGATGHPWWRHLATTLPVGQTGDRDRRMPVLPRHPNDGVQAGGVAEWWRHGPPTPTAGGSNGWRERPHVC